MEVLPHAGRAHQADNLSRLLGRQALHRQNLDKALLHFFQAVVVPVQDALGSLEVQPLFRGLLPGQLQAGVQVHADDTGLVGAVGHAVELVALLEELLLAHLGQLEGLHLFPQLVGLLLGAVLLPQLAGDGPHLLLEEVFPLVLVHLGLGLLVDFVLHRQDFHFLREDINELLHAL